jgi:hypothetical protein
MMLLSITNIVKALITRKLLDIISAVTEFEDTLSQRYEEHILHKIHDNRRWPHSSNLDSAMYAVQPNVNLTGQRLVNAPIIV